VRPARWRKGLLKPWAGPPSSARNAPDLAIPRVRCRATSHVPPPERRDARPLPATCGSHPELRRRRPWPSLISVPLRWQEAYSPPASPDPERTAERQLHQSRSRPTPGVLPGPARCRNSRCASRLQKAAGEPWRDRRRLPARAASSDRKWRAGRGIHLLPCAGASGGDPA
jgi:hypothetical protein